VDLELVNRRVLITGASRGIGAATANAFLNEGAIVSIVSRGSEELDKTKSTLTSKFGEGKVHSFNCDCKNSASLQLLKSKINEKFDGLDIVVANIGDGSSVNSAIPNDEDWINAWDNNFETALKTARTFLPMLRKSKGNLLFVSSIAGIEAIDAPVAYATAKTAVAALAKNMSKKLGAEVRVNVIAPGNILFPNSEWDKKIKKNSKEVMDYITSNVPMGRFGTTNEIANSIVFLCSSKASFITGSVLVVDGGQTQRII
jgi:3-oxoacyl-[acyl-carrier protein] reductase